MNPPTCSAGLKKIYLFVQSLVEGPFFMFVFQSEFHFSRFIIIIIIIFFFFIYLLL
jgi:hypothetical protein